MRDRRRLSLERSQRGFVLIALVALLAMGGLYFLVQNLSPENMQARSQRKTDDALAQAREALIGYAVRFREDQLATGTSGLVYGYLPLPDLGTSRNNNAGCADEGCDAANFTGNGPNITVIGRFPWRALGTGPLRDGSGECLWYAISGSHQRIQRANPMNWDTLGQTDIVIANGTAAMASTLAAAPHDRPIAVIFAPGPPLAGQDRGPSTIAPLDIVTECGGNYDPRNYLDPADTSLLGGPANFFPAANRLPPDKPWLDRTMAATAGTNKAFSIGGAVNRRSDATLWDRGCTEAVGMTCAQAANDRGLAVTGEMLFRVLRGSSYFRTDINAMLDRMTTCLRDQIAAGPGFTPDAIAGFTAPADKSVGRIPASACYDDTQNPLGYFSHYRDQFFVAKPSSGLWTVTVDGTAQASCSAALLFAGQRGTKNPAPTDAAESLVQLRTADVVSGTNPVTNRNWPANYLEGSNILGFSTLGIPAFAGPSLFSQVSATQTASQDIVRCIPTGASLTVVAPTVAASAGNIQLAAYAPATGLLTLGSADISSNYGANAASLFACAWTPEAQAAGAGFRSYFRFRIRRVGEGFTFAVIDGNRNGADVCGAARQHLGYSGNNGTTPYIAWPKLAIEFDTSRQCNSSTFDTTGRPACFFTESGDTLRNGRNDPCYTTSCWEDSPLYPGIKQSLDNSSHVAVVYWGYGSALSQQSQDDNVHDQPGMPMPLDPSARPGPRNPAPVLPYVANPATIPGIAPLDRMGGTDASQREFHARLEVTRSFTTPADPKDGATGLQVKFWIEPQAAANIAAMTFHAGSPPSLEVTTASAHSLTNGDTVVIQDAVPTGYNGEYPVTITDATHFTATLPSAKINPGPYVSSMKWRDNTYGSCVGNKVTVTSAEHGLNTGDIVTIAGAIPPEFNGSHTVTAINSTSYCFNLALPYEPGNLEPGIAAHKALTPRATAMTNTTRPMSDLDASFKPLVSDAATIYDQQTGTCNASEPKCPIGQACASDNMCYRPAFRNLRLGFTLGERPTTSTTTARGQLIEINNRATTWLP